MKKIILFSCIILCALNSYGQNEYELSLMGEWELYAVLVDNFKDDSGSIHIKDIYDESKPVICIFKADNTYQMKSENSILEEGSWNISNNGNKLTICKVDEEGEKFCESRKLYNGKHDYSEEEFGWFGEVCLLVDEKIQNSSWSESSYKRKKVESFTQKEEEEDLFSE